MKIKRFKFDFDLSLILGKLEGMMGTNKSERLGQYKLDDCELILDMDSYSDSDSAFSIGVTLYKSSSGSFRPILSEPFLSFNNISSFFNILSIANPYTDTVYLIELSPKKLTAIPKTSTKDNFNEFMLNMFRGLYLNENILDIDALIRNIMYYDLSDDSNLIKVSLQILNFFEKGLSDVKDEDKAKHLINLIYDKYSYVSIDLKKEGKDIKLRHKSVRKAFYDYIKVAFSYEDMIKSLISYMSEMYCLVEDIILNNPEEYNDYFSNEVENYIEDITDTLIINDIKELSRF